MNDLFIAPFAYTGLSCKTTNCKLCSKVLQGVLRCYDQHESEVLIMTEEQKLINVQIGKRLQTVRENMGYTQEAFAEVLSVDAGHYQKLERGLYGLSIQLSRLERTPDKREVGGSSPLKPTKRSNPQNVP